MKIYLPDMSQRVAVVTGAARGMGAATTRAFLNAGASVVAIDLSWDSIDEFWLASEEFKSELAGFGDRCLCVSADVSDEDSLDRAYEQTMSRFGTVDTIINNAALLQHHLFKPTGRVRILDTTPQDWTRMLQVNVVGVLNVLRRFTAPMIQKGKGSIVNISSSSSVPEYSRPDSLEQPYMASKAAVTNMTVYLASELREDNVAANVVFAGHAEMTGFGSVDIARAKLGFPTPRSRSVPEHIVPILAFLGTHDTNDGPTGQIFLTPKWNAEIGLGHPTPWLRENVRSPIEYAISEVGLGVEF